MAGRGRPSAAWAHVTPGNAREQTMTEPNPGPPGDSEDERRWQAVCRRDPGADGGFVYAVRSTGVYCRRALGQLVEIDHFLPVRVEIVIHESERFNTVTPIQQFHFFGDFLPAELAAADDKERRREGDDPAHDQTENAVL